MVAVAVAINHRKVSVVPDSSNPNLIQPSDWNDEHLIDADEFTNVIMPVTSVTGASHTAESQPGVSIYTVYNQSGSAYNFNLPATPSVNQVVQVLDAGLTAGTHQINVNGNGNDVCAYGEIGTTAAIVNNGGTISLAWDGTQWTQNG